MTKAGKKALRDAAEESQRRKIEKEEKDEKEREQRTSNPVAEQPVDPEKYYWIPTSETEKKRMTTAANRIYKLAQKYEDNNDDVTPSMLVLARDSLPAALKLLRMPINWEMDEGRDGVDNNVTKTMVMICGLAPTAGVRLSRIEIADIWAITNLLCIADEDWWDEYWENEFEELIGECFLSEGIAILAEIAQQDVPLKGRLSLCFLAEIVNNDCTADDILRICAAYTHILYDPRSEDWSNGMVYSGIFNISNQLRWTQILCDNLVEPAREAALEGNVDAACFCECDFPLLLLRLSMSLAKAKARIAEGTTCDQLGCYDDDDDDDDDDNNEHDVCDLPTSEEWSFFFEVFERNPDGIDMCDCTHKEPKLFW